MILHHEHPCPLIPWHAGNLVGNPRPASGTGEKPRDKKPSGKPSKVPSNDHQRKEPAKAS